MSFFVEFHELGHFKRSLNSTYIILIPKKGGIDDLKDFRPISLVVSLCKLLAKVLTNKLKRVVGKVRSNSQYTFVSGRQILDTILIANKVIDSRLKNLKGGLFARGTWKRLMTM